MVRGIQYRKDTATSDLTVLGEKLRQSWGRIQITDFALVGNAAKERSSASSMTQVVVGRTKFLACCWPKAFLGPFPQKSLQKELTTCQLTLSS